MLDTHAINEILNTEAGQKLTRRYQEEKAEARMQRVNERAELRTQRGESLKPLTEELTKVSRDVENAQAMLKQAEEKHRIVQAKHSQIKASYDSRITRIERELVQTAPREIDRFIESLRDDIDKLRRAGISSRQEPTGRTYASGVAEMCGFSNAKSLERRLQAMRDAITTAERYKLTACDSLQDQLDQLVEKLPPVVMEEVQ